MEWVDYFIVGVVVLSALISLMRGFVREAFSLATWILAFWVALAFTGTLDAHLARWIETPSLRTIVAFSTLFILMLIAGAMINHFASLTVKKTGLTGTDRLLGALFGIARGVVVVAALALLAIVTEFNQDPWWEHSMFIPLVEPLALWMAEFLPEDLSGSLPEVEPDVDMGPEHG